LLVITGPSGVGKGSVIRALRARRPQIGLSISATTRSPRAGETDGVDYHFLSEEQFEQRVRDGAFVEYADYAGQRYGTLRSELEASPVDVELIVLEIELQGARQIRESMPEAVQVFIAPPSFDSLRERLIGRGTDSAETIEQRLAVAHDELAAQDEFSEVIVNDSLDAAVDALDALVESQLGGAVD